VSRSGPASSTLEESRSCVGRRHAQFLGLLVPLRFLVEPEVTLAETVNLTGGSPYAGKSTLCAQRLAAHLGEGTFPAPSGTLSFARIDADKLGILFCDRPQHDNDLWLKKLNLLNRIRVYDTLNEPNPDLVGYQIVEQALAQPLKGVEYLVVETADAAIGGDYNDPKTVRRELRRLQAVAMKWHVTLELNVYGNKTKGRKEDRYADPIERIGGTAALRGCASAAVFIASEADTKDVGCGYQALTIAPRRGPRFNYLVERYPREHELGGLFHYDPAAAYHAEDKYGDLTPEQLEALTGPAAPIYTAIAAEAQGITRTMLQQVFQDMPKTTRNRHIELLVETRLVEEIGDKLRAAGAGGRGSVGL